MKILKVGYYRVFFILASTALLVSFGTTENPIVLAGVIAVISGWVIFEINIVLQAVLGVQRMFAYMMQQGNKVPVKNVMEIKEPAVKLIDVNSAEETTNEA